VHAGLPHLPGRSDAGDDSLATGHRQRTADTEDNLWSASWQYVSVPDVSVYQRRRWTTVRPRASRASLRRFARHVFRFRSWYSVIHTYTNTRGIDKTSLCTTETFVSCVCHF